MHSLPVFLRLRDRPVILAGKGEGAEAKRRLLERAGARIVGEEAQAALAVVGDDDAAAERLRVRGVLVNATDRPELCDFTLPAIVDRNPVLVAVGTGGASAGLAAALRQRLETLLPARLGELAAALDAAKPAIAAHWPDAGERRRALGRGLSAGGALDPFGVAPDVALWLDEADHARSEVHVVALRSDDPDDLTLRDARMLGQADRVYHQRHVSAEILARARADAARIAGSPPAIPLPGLSVEIQPG